MPTAISAAPTPSTRNGIRQASAAPNSELPRSISGAASSMASVMPMARPVITTPIPRLRFASGVCAAIRLRSLE